MFAYLTLIKRSFGVTKGLLIRKTAKIEALTILPLFWTTITSWIDGPTSMVTTLYDNLSIPWDMGVWLPMFGEN